MTRMDETGRYYGSGGGFWLLGFLAGFGLYLALPNLIAFGVALGRGVLLLVALAVVLLLPFFGVWATRRVVKARERRRRSRNAVPCYADGAYIV